MSQTTPNIIEKFKYISRLHGIYKLYEQKSYGEFITLIQSGVVRKKELIERSRYINPLKDKELNRFNEEIIDSFNGVFKNKIFLYSKRGEEVKKLLLSQISKKINLVNLLQIDKDRLFFCISLLFAFETFNDPFSLKEYKNKKPNQNIIISIIIGVSIIIASFIYAYSNRYYVKYPIVIDKWTQEYTRIKKSN